MLEAGLMALVMVMAVINAMLAAALVKVSGNRRRRPTASSAESHQRKERDQEDSYVTSDCFKF